MVEHEGPVKVSVEGSVEGGVNHPSLQDEKGVISKIGYIVDRTSASKIHVLLTQRAYRYASLAKFSLVTI